MLYYAHDDAKRCLEPLEMRRCPRTIPEAKLSLPFTVALALAYRTVEIGSFCPQTLEDPLLADLCQTTGAASDESLKSTLSKTMLPGRVRVEMEDGEAFDERVDVVYGHPRNRMRWDDLKAKFEDCASHARRPFGAAEEMCIRDRCSRSSARTSTRAWRSRPSSPSCRWRWPP